MTTPEEIEQLKQKLAETLDAKEQADILVDLLGKYSSTNNPESQPYIDHLQQLADNLDSAEHKAWAAHFESGVYRRKGDSVSAIPYSQLAVSLFQFIGHQKGMATAHNGLANGYFYLSNYPHALKNYLAAINIREKILAPVAKGTTQNADDRKAIALLYSNTGNVYKNLGNYTEALEYFTAALKIAEEIGDNANIANPYSNIGNVYEDQGNYPEALIYYTAALKIYEKTENRNGAVGCIHNIGNVYCLQGNYEAALEAHKANLRTRTEIGDRRGIADSHSSMGSVYTEQGNYSEALKNYLACLKINEEIGYKESITTSYESLGALYHLQGNYPEALANYLTALKIREEKGDKKGIADSYINIGNVYHDQGNLPEVLPNYMAALKIREEIDNKWGIANASNHIGIYYNSLRNYSDALNYNLSALKIREELGEKRGIAASFKNIGSDYYGLCNYNEALSGYKASLKMSEQIGQKEFMSLSSIGMGMCYTALGEYERANEYLQQGIKLAKEIGLKGGVKDALKGFYKLKKVESDGMAALSYYEQYVETEKEMQNEETSKKIAGLQFGYQIEKKEQEVVFERQKKDELQVAYDLLGEEKERSENLLLNILPAEVAEELKEKGTAEAKLFDNVTVLFTDFKDFTKHCERLNPQQLVNELHACFTGFDEIVSKYGIEKIKTVGDAYLAVSGLPLANYNHAVDMVKAALEIKDFMRTRRQEAQTMNQHCFEIRIGVHSGHVVAGIVGVKKFAYDIWGDTVNTAARMEQNGEAGKVNISETTYQLVKDKFTCEDPGRNCSKK